MSKRRAGGIAGTLAALAVGVGLVAERTIVAERRKAAPDADRLGTLHSQARTVIASDGVHLHAEVDEVVDPAQVFEHFEHMQPPVELLRFADTGHFFHGKLHLIRELIEWFLDDVLDELGSRKEVEYAYKILNEGTSADRQLATWRETGNLHDVVDRLVAETAEGVR